MRGRDAQLTNATFHQGLYLFTSLPTDNLGPIRDLFVAVPGTQQVWDRSLLSDKATQ